MRDGLEHGMRHYLISIRAKDLKFQTELKGNASAGLISDVKTILIKDGRIVTIVKTNTNKLKVIVWDVDLGGARIMRRGSGGGQTAKVISACNLGLDMFATAIMTDNNILKINTWKISESGDVIPKDNVSSEKLGTGSDILSVCRLGIEWLATAFRAESGRLKIIIWHIGSDGEIEQLTSAHWRLDI